MSANTQSKKQKKIKKVMGEFKSGDLRSGGSGRKVTNPKQAIAIALAEANRMNKGGMMYEEIMNRPMFQTPQMRQGGGIMAGIAPIRGYAEGDLVSNEEGQELGLEDLTDILLVDPDDPVDVAMSTVTAGLMMGGVTAPGAILAGLARMGYKGKKALDMVERVGGFQAAQRGIGNLFGRAREGIGGLVGQARQGIERGIGSLLGRTPKVTEKDLFGSIPKTSIRAQQSRHRPETQAIRYVGEKRGPKKPERKMDEGDLAPRPGPPNPPGGASTAGRSFAQQVGRGAKIGGGLTAGVGVAAPFAAPYVGEAVDAVSEGIEALRDLPYVERFLNFYGLGDPKIGGTRAEPTAHAAAEIAKGDVKKRADEAIAKAKAAEAEAKRREEEAAKRKTEATGITKFLFGKDGIGGEPGFAGNVLEKLKDPRTQYALAKAAQPSEGIAPRSFLADVGLGLAEYDALQADDETALMQNYEFLKQSGRSDDEIFDLLLSKDTASDQAERYQDQVLSLYTTAREDAKNSDKSDAELLEQARLTAAAIMFRQPVGTSEATAQRVTLDP